MVGATATTVNLDDWVQLVRGEYLEMPGLRLTGAQARRLWALDRTDCDAILERLVAARFLVRAPDGAYHRADQSMAAR